MRSVRRVVLFAALMTGLLFRPFPVAAAPPATETHGETGDNPVINFQNGRMTLKTRSAPLLPLLEKIAAVADVRIVCFSKISADQLVTADLSGWPLEKALVSLLNSKDFNFMVIFTPGDGKQGVELRAGMLSGSAAPKAPQPGAGSGGLTPHADRAGQSSGSPAGPGAGRGKPGSRDREKGGGAGAPVEKDPGQMTGSLRIEGRRYSTNAAPPGAAGLPGPAGAMNAAASQQSEKFELEAVVQFASRYKKPRKPENASAESARLAAKKSREEFIQGQIDMLTQRIESGVSDREFQVWSKIKDPRYLQNDRTLLKRYKQELATLKSITQ